MLEERTGSQVKRKKIWPWGLLAVPVLAVLGYVGYAQAAYYRLEDRLPLEVEDQQDQLARPDTEYTLLSYNVGFLAYSADYSFFMDGGEESRARSAQAVETNGPGRAGDGPVGVPGFFVFAGGGCGCHPLLACG